MSLPVQEQNIPIGIEFVQTRSVNQLLEDYQIPEDIKQLKLRHGENLMDRNLLYETVMQGSTPEVYDSIRNNSNTFYKNIIYFSLPGCKKYKNIKQELINANIISKPMNGPYCPRCDKTNTTFFSEQIGACDEGQKTFIKCYDCNVEFKNPKVVFPSDK